MKENSIIIGAGTQGQVYASYLKEAGVNIVGFIDDDPQLLHQEVIGIPVLGNYQDLFSTSFKEKIQNVYCPIGNNHIRVKYLSTLKKEGYSIPSFIHKTVHIAPDVSLGEAVYMLVGNIVMPHTSIGSYIMVNMDSTIAHHVTLEDGVFLSSGVNIGACIHVKSKAYVGMGVTAMTGIKTIGEDCLLGAGTVIIKDVPDYATVVGNPGRVIKYKEVNNEYAN
ncbi:NeuD/PglB/VioB family sugar acetyltransferase [Galbibacter sp. BG1]|uniref:NeuD/PglB/VioB family sugar acetyltransferase n=1 Tax=Galbibacter sp. BG1 TaxID=1170699 RepID=UPI0015BA6D7B|nr:NeuD/PglB/VioB family sugar acetyltransferase [Galbibacter sp. BG1]QLE02501.1 NeuD/PglB/VioB family sugar acetyltransferase [Galbibacter sp. BG1]